MPRQPGVTMASLTRSITALERAGQRVTGIEHRPDGSVFITIAGATDKKGETADAYEAWKQGRAS